MVRDALLDCTEHGDLVIDCFGGGGATLIAAEMIGRRSRIMELDPGYCEVMIRRWEAFTGQGAVLLDTGQTYREVRGANAQPAPSARVRTRTRPGS
jgi:DNA modification methylase